MNEPIVHGDLFLVTLIAIRGRLKGRAAALGCPQNALSEHQFPRIECLRHAAGRSAF